jgi:hypothetical protein
MPVLLEALRQAWERYPDQRLGQLVVNAVREAGIDTPPTPVFNLDDHKMLASLEALAAR